VASQDGHRSHPSIQIETTDGKILGHQPEQGTLKEEEEAHDGLAVPNDALGKSKSHLSGTSTPPGRRSVQFARPVIDSEAAQQGHKRTASGDSGGGDTPTRAGPSRLLSKLRNLTSSASGHPHTRSPSAWSTVDSAYDRHASSAFQGTFAEEGTTNSPRGYGSEVEADGEDSGADDTDRAETRARRRKSRRERAVVAQTAPATPRTPFMRDGRPHLLSFGSQNFSEKHLRPSFLHRRSTNPEGDGSRLGVSEDEGRDRLARTSPRRRTQLRNLTSGSISKGRQGSADETSTPRPSTFRRAITGLGGTSDGRELLSPWKQRSERTGSLSAAKWKQLKAGLKLIGRQKKIENTVDHQKSAELLAELTAGVPAVLMLASMFQRDEHGHKRIPVLMEQLKVYLTEIKGSHVSGSDRQTDWRINLEYGNGLTRQKWFVDRTIRDFANLHARYRLQNAQNKITLKGEEKVESKSKFPRFPRSAFPYLRGLRGLEGLDSESEGEEDVNIDLTGPSGGDASGTDRPRKTRRRSTTFLRRKSSMSAEADGTGTATAEDTPGPGTMTPRTPGPVHRKDPYSERQRKKLEIYLQQLIRYHIFRAESNRLCKFLELSSLGIRLAVESAYHGKEGFLVIQSGKGVDFRKSWTPTNFKGRHRPKWFLVRHSYIVCVDSPDSMIVYDVFLVDSDFKLQPKKQNLPIKDQTAKDTAKDLAKTATHATHAQHHRLKIHNSERKVRLLAKNERQLQQFEDSIRFMLSTTPWVKKQRFDSFAPVRQNVAAQWLVDGRDYMWNVSRAMSMAKDSILIHDWWLSPELYMRRPAAISQKWRLDRLLQRKAREGVKIFVVMYRNIDSAIPIDSEYSKFALLDLHENISVQRSPNQLRQGTFFWAHHEKICVVDHMIAFVGGVDLCFGRWDTPQHNLTDDKKTGFELSSDPKDADHCQLWPGKDYSNPRVQDFYALDKPYEEMYDREKVPRMPWHDIAMQVVGQPARDLARHFVQRWNYVLRQRKPSRPTPMMIPPPDFEEAELEAIGLKGTCEVQMLRSCSMWSMGTPDRVEHSIMNAYVKTIQESEHFVYIENQFFISSCEVEGTRIMNLIGDALVERIIKAYENSEKWRALIVIPLLPGFQNTVDQQDGSSVRLIMQCQFRSINRGETSIFGRLRAKGIEPRDFVEFYSLRAWGKIGPQKELVTEQLYIHAKCMVVDDRVAIIGSANINERSMLGSRDSECAAIVRDTKMKWSTMAGKPYLVGEFPHTLRMRLMREHLGIDVDELAAAEQAAEEEAVERELNEMYSGSDTPPSHDDHLDGDVLLNSKHQLQDDLIAKETQMRRPKAKAANDRSQGRHLDAGKFLREKLAPSSKSEGHAHGITDFEPSANQQANGHFSPNRPEASSLRVRDQENDAPFPELPTHPVRQSTFELGLPVLSQLPPLPKGDDTDIGGPPLQRTYSTKAAAAINPALATMQRPFVDKDCMRDPLNDEFYKHIWHEVAENNTELFRTVFRCNPDNKVETWKEYKEYEAYKEKFSEMQGGGSKKQAATKEAPPVPGPPGGTNGSFEKFRNLAASSSNPAGENSTNVAEHTNEKIASADNQMDAEKSTPKLDEKGAMRLSAENTRNCPKAASERSFDPNDEKIDLKKNSSGAKDSTTSAAVEKTTTITPTASDNPVVTGSQRRRRRTTKSKFMATDEMIKPEDAEELLGMVQGSLVVWPYDWLSKEEQGGNWLYSIDGLAPLEI
jgi:phospholipase D1/2